MPSISRTAAVIAVAACANALFACSDDERPPPASSGGFGGGSGSVGAGGTGGTSGGGSGGMAGGGGGAGGAAGTGAAGMAGGAGTTGCDLRAPVNPESGCNGRGPSMVEVSASGTSYCVDDSEVTNAQYEQFLDDCQPGAQVTGCGFNTSFEPSTWPVDSQLDQLPVVGVDWCDAAAYCAWAGKRLCGSIGGGTVTQLGSADDSEWFRACTNGGTTLYSYGDTYDGNACNGGEAATGGPVAVQSSTSCRGTTAPFAGVYDLIANVAEWEDNCSGTAGAGDQCTLRGGSFATAVGLGPTAERCAYTNDTATRGELASDVGFRCCK